jgi:hypothetical protein
MYPSHSRRKGSKDCSAVLYRTRTDAAEPVSDHATVCAARHSAYATVAAREYLVPLARLCGLPNGETHAIAVHFAASGCVFR